MPLTTVPHSRGTGLCEGRTRGPRAATSPHDPAGFGGQWGYYTDTETGLLCLTHRYYDPGTGKFINRDPIGYDGGMNLYGFAGGNPVNNQDPSGFIPKPIGGLPSNPEGDKWYPQNWSQAWIRAQNNWQAIPGRLAGAGEGVLDLLRHLDASECGCSQTAGPVTGPVSGNASIRMMRSGRATGNAGTNWENAVRKASGGKEEEFEVVENGLTKKVQIDSVTKDALIEAKEINVATARNFLSQATRRQIKRTIGLANSQNKRAEFWFKDEPVEGVREYIKAHGGSVKVGL